ncbi:type VI secretion system tip protein VgrG [Aquabacter sp. L1I39]|uniref:type VI secretion system Vgr family protein n=1 Tax=Aquabacter sp. L1I39 TaxID=2820278 RepID=UPI001AD96D05|nr:type VI secretion system tip protein VgrG [Aquabacter sp. L1I39]QTL01711.1 type VI secretion system tip protein VgrG [Aquabacter sp. L1I39]
MSSATPPVQTGRLITLTTPLGGDVLLATAIEGREAISDLFRFKLSLVSANAGITAAQLLGKPVTVMLNLPSSSPRPINGIVSAFSAGARTVDGLRHYEAVLSPRLWLLTRTVDCRVFQHQSVVQIAQTLLSEGGISDYQTKALSSSHPSRDYCVQYRESDFDFLARICAEEGIYFYFQHAEGKHTLILSDSVSGYGDVLATKVQHAPPESGLTLAVQSFQQRSSFRSGKTTLRDYNFEQPTSDLTASTSTVLDNAAFKGWEVFDYPGGYDQKGDGTSRSRTRMEAIEAGYGEAEGQSTLPQFAPGMRFTLSDHEVSAEENKTYVLSAVDHRAADVSHLGNQDNVISYTNTFAAVPSTVALRPPGLPIRPLIPGPQTALVVGPSGEEIYCDKYGRVRVQFFWDRLGKKDDQSSCWVRVAQMLSGPGFGTHFIPRVGMEVVVVFLDGAPDRPLIVGCVPNGQNLPPYTLPDNKTQSGIKTRSSSQGSAATFNELRFEDKKGAELVYVHAQKDFTREVENDDTLTVQHDQTLTIKNNRTETIQEGNESVTVSKGNRSVTVSQGNDSLTVSKGNVSTTVSSGNHSLSLGSGNASTTCDGGSITLKAAQSITLKVGGNSLTINQSGMTLKATQITITADAKLQLGAPMVKVNGDGTVQVQGGLVTLN